MKWCIILDYCPETQNWIARCAELPDCVSFGASADEALANIKEVIERYLWQAQAEEWASRGEDAIA